MIRWFLAVAAVLVLGLAPAAQARETGVLDRTVTVDGKAYVPNDRLDAYQAGRLDAGTISPPQLVRAVAQGLDLRVVVSLKQEAEGGFNTQFVALEDSDIDGPEDLKGKRIGILSPTTSTDYWARSAIAGAGLVVTGTALSGEVAVGDEVRVLLAGAAARVRSLHAQNAPAQRGRAGQRLALNLTGFHKARIERGEWIVRGELPPPASLLHCCLQLTRMAAT